MMRSLDYGIADEDMEDEILNEWDVPNYDTVEKTLNQQGMNDKKSKAYLVKF